MVTLELPKGTDPKPITEDLIQSGAADRAAAITCRIADRKKDAIDWSNGGASIRFQTHFGLDALTKIVNALAPSAEMLIG